MYCDLISSSDALSPLSKGKIASFVKIDTSSNSTMDQINISAYHKNMEQIWLKLSAMNAHHRCQISACGFYKSRAGATNLDATDTEDKATHITLSSDLSDTDAPCDSSKPVSRGYITNTLEIIPSQVFETLDYDQISIVGLQKHLCNLEAYENCANSLFNFMRLSDIRNDISIAEVILRESRNVVFDLNVIRHADLPGDHGSSSNGLYMEEACQLMKYIGASNHLTSLEITSINFNNLAESKYYDAIATLLWYYIEGTSFKSDKDEALSEKKEYVVYPEGVDTPIHFFNENQSNRWWCSVTESADDLIACSPADYENAKSGKYSDRLMKILDLY